MQSTLQKREKGYTVGVDCKVAFSFVPLQFDKEERNVGNTVGAVHAP